MAKPTRSPVVGYNHNVKHKGRIFHVQTEDSGPTNPHIYTHLYFEGTILGSKKMNYDAAAPEELVRSLMQGQHKAILKDLKAGQNEARIAAFFKTRGEVYGDPEAELPAAAVAAVQAAAKAGDVLDLDSLPPPSGDTPPPQVMPMRIPVPAPGRTPCRSSNTSPLTCSTTYRIARERTRDGRLPLECARCTLHRADRN